MKNTISENFKTNGKAVSTGKVSKEETLAKLGIVPGTTKPVKTYIMINGVPCNPVTKEPFKTVK